MYVKELLVKDSFAVIVIQGNYRALNWHQFCCLLFTLLLTLVFYLNYFSATIIKVTTSNFRIMGPFSLSMPIVMVFEGLFDHIPVACVCLLIFKLQRWQLWSNRLCCQETPFYIFVKISTRSKYPNKILFLFSMAWSGLRRRKLIYLKTWSEMVIKPKTGWRLWASAQGSNLYGLSNHHISWAQYLLACLMRER